MPSTREAALMALHGMVSQAVSALGVDVLRNEPDDLNVPAAGRVILFDGDPGEPDVTLNPVRYSYQHVAELVVLVQARAGRDGAFDDICIPIGEALIADPQLGGAVDYVEASAPDAEDHDIEGGQDLKLGRISITLHYETSNPLN